MIAKRILLLCTGLVAALALLEGGIRVLHRIRTGEPFPTDVLRERLAPPLDPDAVVLATTPVVPRQDAATVANKALHPYLGYVLDRTGAEATINRFGFQGIDPLTPAGPDVVRVAITGGSVSLQVYTNGGDALKAALADAPALRGKRIELVSLALGGYKQPQQLMAVAWLLSLGAHFDVVINLDGFNEVALPYADNHPAGVHPGYPRGWQLYQSGGVDAGQAGYLVATRALREEQRAFRSALATGLPSRSALCLTVLQHVDDLLEARIARQDHALRHRLAVAGTSFQASGPPVSYDRPADLFADEVAIWQRSSLELQQLARGAGAHYFHFLQPNQWLEGGKPWSRIEKSQLDIPDPWAPRTAVRMGYPLLEEAGRELRARGVAFTSLAWLFRAEPRTLYRDTCCHLNELGVRLLASEIGRVVAGDLPAHLDEPPAANRKNRAASRTSAPSGAPGGPPSKKDAAGAEFSDTSSPPAPLP